MNTQKIFLGRRELAHRSGGGLEVTLYWHADDDRTSIDVWHAASDETLSFFVPRDRALEAYYHPFAHLPNALDEVDWALAIGMGL